MRTTETNATEEVLDYIDTLPQFSKNICVRLRKIILTAVPDIIEDWKFHPVYNWLGAVCGYTCFQKHVRLTFFNGAVMSDFKKMFDRNIDNQFIRSIKYADVSELDDKTLRSYVKESASLNEWDFKHKIKSNEVAIPGSLKGLLLLSNATSFFKCETPEKKVK